MAFIERHGHTEPVVNGTAIIDETTSIDVTGPVTIGRHVVIGEDVLILTHAHEPDPGHGNVAVYGLTIGEGAFIGARAIILATCRRIGAHAIIGAGAVVTKDVPDGERWAGNPARRIG
jgi:acetyltransferase-like isoleucine patch superfamily enzyme